MIKKYIAVRFPLEAYNNLIEKKIRMEKAIMQLTGRKETIPLTKIITTISRTPITLNDDTLVNLSRGKKVRKIKRVMIV